MRTTLIANNINEFLDHVSLIKKNWFDDDDSWGPWFRGHLNASWDLVPKLYRGEIGTYKRINEDEIEDEIREEFICRAPNFFELEPKNEWEWYFLMRHFGLQTRLLDWTDGALLALYFAVKDTKGEFDAAVWVLDPWKLNRTSMSLKEDMVISPSAYGVTEKDIKLVAPWLPKQFTKKLSKLPAKPIAIYPTHIDKRLSSQRSCFTIHGSDPNGLNEYRYDSNGCLAMIKIPSFVAEAIRQDLYVCGIDESTIFPDLEGLGRAISARWRPIKPKIPHKNVYTRLRPSGISKDELGVFAIVPIKKGTEIFPGDIDEMVWVDKKTLPKWPKEILKLYEDFAVIKDNRYGCPTTFNRLTMSWYINHSDTPNVYCDDNYIFIALKNIKRGEELTADYSAYNDPEALNFLRR
jgi:hypothetical protein